MESYGFLLAWQDYEATSEYDLTAVDRAKQAASSSDLKPQNQTIRHLSLLIAALSLLEGMTGKPLQAYSTTATTPANETLANETLTAPDDSMSHDRSADRSLDRQQTAAATVKQTPVSSEVRHPVSDRVASPPQVPDVTSQHAVLLQRTVDSASVEPSRAEPLKVESSKAEPLKTEPSNIETVPEPSALSSPSKSDGSTASVSVLSPVLETTQEATPPQPPIAKVAPDKQAIAPDREPAKTIIPNAITRPDDASPATPLSASQTVLQSSIAVLTSASNTQKAAPIAAKLRPQPVLVAQAIVPAADGTGTQVKLDGNRFNIDGGTLSGDRANLFHSFQRLGLNADQVANFMSNPNIRNILGRVVGGDPSVINGLVQVTGGNSNLFLMNPAGIVFGANARLDVPGSFTATTANGIKFGEQWFNATGSNNYAGLVGNPNAFAFTMNQPGAIVNAGDLAVADGKQLTLVGGTVVNTGKLSAPGGQITIAAVPGGKQVQINQDGVLLGLRVQPLGSNRPNAIPFTPSTLPVLLTGGTNRPATGVVVNPDGTVQLTDGGTTIPTTPGTAIASGSLDVSGQVGGNVGVFGDRVGVINGTINASGTNGGGTVLIGGDYQGKGTVPNAQQTLVSGNSSIFADAIKSGDGGKVVIWSDQATQVDGKVTARGTALNPGSNGGLVEISSQKNLAFQGDVDVAAPTGLPGTVLFDPQDINIVAGTGADDAQANSSSILFAQGGATTDFQIGANKLAAISGNITLQASRDINLNTSLNLAGGVPDSTITFTANRNFNGANQSIVAPWRNISITAGNITLGNLDTTGNLNTVLAVASDVSYNVIGRIFQITSPTFTAASNGTFSGNVASVAPGASLSVSGNYTFNPVDTSFCPGCVIQAYMAWIPPAPVDSQGFYNRGASGASSGSFNWTTTAPTTPGTYYIGLASTLDFRFQPNQVGGTGTTPAGITAASYRVTVGSGVPAGGSISLNGTGNITTGTLSTNGEAITLNTAGNITTGAIDSNAGSARTNSGGAITLTSTAGSINVSNSITTTSTAGTGGSVTLSAPTSITVQGINSSSTTGTGGNITVTGPVSGNNDLTVNAGTGTVITGAVTNPGRALSITGGSITTGDISTSITAGNRVNGGNVSLTATTGNLNVGQIDTQARSFFGFIGNGGNTTLNATSGSINVAGSITTNTTAVGAIDTANNAGNITIAAPTGTVNITNSLSAQAIAQGGDTQVGNGGSVTINAATINLTNIVNTSAVTLGVGSKAGTGGNITVTGPVNGNSDLTVNAGTGTVSTGAITALGRNLTIAGATVTTGNINTGDFGTSAIDARKAGNVKLSATGGNLVAGNITTSANDDFPGDTSVPGAGNVMLEATGTVTAGAIDASAYITGFFSGDGGSIDLAAGGNIQTQAINALSGGGFGGSIKISSNTGSIQTGDLQALSYAGGGGRDVTITANNGNITTGNIDAYGNFTNVGGAIQANTTTGTITTGNVTTDNNAITLNGSVVLGAANTTITNRNSSGNITVTGPINSNNDLTVNAGTGTVSTGAITNPGHALNITGGSITAQTIDTRLASSGSGAVSLTANSGGITVNNISADSSDGGKGGAIFLQATGDITTNGVLHSYSFDGRSAGQAPAGSPITITSSNGNIALDGTQLDASSAVFTGTAANGGAITISAPQGSITSNSALRSESRADGTAGNGGAITLLAANNTTLSNNISTFAQGNTGNGGAVTLNAASGSIAIASNTTINTSAPSAGKGGAVSISAPTTVTTGRLTASNGDISITSNEINLGNTLSSTGNLLLQPLSPSQSIALGNTTDSGTDTLDLTTGDLNALQNGFSSITIGRENGSGTINVAENTTFQDPTTLRTPGGKIILNGGITLFDNATLSFNSANQPTTFLSRDIITTERSTSPLNFYGSVQLSNDITISTGNDIRFNGTLDGDRRLTLRAGDGTVQFNGAVGATTPLSSLLVNSQTTNVASNITTNGDLTLNSAVNLSNGAIVRSRGASITATGTITGVGGTPVDFKADGNISIQDATSTAGILLESKKAFSGRNLTAPGTAITVIASDSIKAGGINASSSTGKGGDVKLDPRGDIEVAFINAQGGANSVGGNVDITTTAGFFRALGTFTDRNGTLASISTAGGAGGGSITIRNGGGLTKTPFVIGDATKNGASGAITTGTFTLTPVQALLRSFNEGGIQIISTGEQDFTRNLVEPKQQGDQQESKKAAAKQGTDDLLNVVTLISVDKGNASQAVTKLESTSTAQYESYLGLSKEAALPQTVGDANSTLSRIEAAVGIKPAIVYISFAPTGDEPQNQLIQRSALSKSRDQLELILVTSSGQAIRKTVPGATRSRVQILANQFRSAVTSPFRRRSIAPLLEPSQQLYKLLIAPLEPELQRQKIQNLAFILDSGLRSIPMAALYDGQTRSFLIEKYSLGLMPALSLTDTRYVKIRNSKVLAMGASQFSAAGQGALPAVPLELDLIKEQWDAKSLADKDFTLSNLRQQPPFGIVHLATHASFQQGPPNKSYIQFEDKALGLDQLRTLNWSDNPPELVVLSACRTAFGSDEAELGFAGSAIQSRAKSVLASLWSVNDTGASGLMAEFYYQLKTAPIKAEALRKAQLAMLRGDVSIKDGKLHWSGGEKVLPPSLAGLANGDLSHPYYWSAFTLVGSPW